MSSVLRSVRKRKKGRTLGAVDVIDREEYAELEVDAKVELIRSLVPLGLMHIEELLDEEVTALAGERYARKAPLVGGRRHGSNPGTVGLAGQRVPIRVPRIRHVTESEIPLRSYEALHGDRTVNDLLLRRVLYGISCRNDAAAAEAIPRAIGLSGSTVSRAFIQASATKLRELQERDLSGEDVVALVLDGKTFAEATMVVALGITMTGDKRFLGVVETDTENEKVLTPFLRSLVERGLDVSQGLLVIVDGGKGLRAAVRKAFRHRALVQRCQWHTRENVVRDVAKREQPVWRRVARHGQRLGAALVHGSELRDRSPVPRITMVERLLPHIQQFVRVRHVLAGAGALGASLADLLATTGLGIIQVDGRGRIAAANDRALALLRTGEGLVDTGGVLGAAVPADDAVLQGLLTRALPPFGGPGAGGSMTVRRAADPQPLVVHLLPIGQPEPAVCTWPGAAVVVVVDPTRRPRLDPALVAAGLGLTPMESRVAVLLTEGKSLREVAAATGRKETTIRWHLRQIFAKRGIARQAELVRLVLSLAGAAHGRR